MQYSIRAWAYLDPSNGQPFFVFQNIRRAIWTQAQLSGVLSWPEISPGAAGQPGHVTHVATTALTHPKMFGFFNKRKYEDYAFQHMVGVSSLIIINNKNIQENLMLPWLQCVLTEVTLFNANNMEKLGCKINTKIKP